MEHAIIIEGAELRYLPLQVGETVIVYHWASPALRKHQQQNQNEWERMTMNLLELPYLPCIFYTSNEIRNTLSYTGHKKLSDLNHR